MVGQPSAMTLTGQSPMLNGSPRLAATGLTPKVSLTVLLVEDNPIDAMRMRQLMARARTSHFAVESVARLHTAEERLACSGVDLVLLDLSLPDSVGLGTYLSLAHLAPSLPVIVSTGFSRRIRRLRGHPTRGPGLRDEVRVVKAAASRTALTLA